MSSSAFTPSTTTVTNNVPVNVPVVTADKLFVPSIGISGTFSSQKGEYQRAGARMNGRVQLTFATVSAINSPYTLTIPDSLNYDGTNIPVSDEPIVGTFSLWDASASYIEYVGTVHINSATTLKFKAHGQTAFNNSSVPVTIAANDILEIQFSLPIAEWATSGTTTLATRAVEEYASNSSTSTSGNSTAFAYGPSGSPIRSYTSGANVAHSYTVRFQSQILSTDSLILEVSQDRVVWVKIPHYAQSGGQTINEFGHTTTSYYGMGIRHDIGSTTDISVVFGGSGTNSNLDAWSAFTNYFWRVRKVSSGAQVGYPVSARNIVGDTSGSVVPTGMLGEVRTVTGSGTLQVNPSTYGDIAGMSLQLGPGTWMLTLKAAAYIKHNAAGNQINTVNLILTDSSNAVIANSPVQAQVENQPQTSGTAMQFVWNLTSTTVWTNTTTQSIKMRGLRSNLTGGIELLNDSDARITAIIATRIA